MVINDFSSVLLTWYSINKRDLPWREKKDIFFVWISEIMLQQTKIDQVIDYFKRFTVDIPNIEALAQAPENQILKLWQGLGYYSRARNMHIAANQIINLYNGVFPNEYDKIRKLKGIGDYTAGAIASICFNLPYAAVDGNVCRVLSRIFGVFEPIDYMAGKNKIKKLASALMDKNNAGEFNQALMEFGALQCIPRNPCCEDCVFAINCHANLYNCVDQLPVKKVKITRKVRFFNYLFIQFGNFTYLNKRKSNDIWKNLYEFPLIETDENLDENSIIYNKEWIKLFSGNDIFIENISNQTLHLLTHQKIFVRFYKIRLNCEIPDIDRGFLKISVGELQDYPVSKLIANYLDSIT